VCGEIHRTPYTPSLTSIIQSEISSLVARPTAESGLQEANPLVDLLMEVKEEVRVEDIGLESESGDR
jgi:hypothetical protein